MNIVNATSFSELIKKAYDELSKESVCVNLILSGNFPLDEVYSDIIVAHEDIASDWQNPIKPNHLYINHGEYINKYGDAKKFIIDELKHKRDSNRAVISFLNMNDIIKNSKTDTPIPSFMILQFGFTENNYSNLIVTAYFKALEVTKFLPINLAEISYYIKELKKEFFEIETFELTIHAFKSYIKPQFNCLRKAVLDSLDWTIIAKEVSNHNISKIHEWIYSKLLDVSSVVCIEGLENLYKAINAWSESYNKELINALEKVLIDMKQLKDVRKISSYSCNISNLEEKIQKDLKTIIEILEEENINGIKRDNGITI
jgi:hypothetical protein